MNIKKKKKDISSAEQYEPYIRSLNRARGTS